MSFNQHACLAGECDLPIQTLRRGHPDGSVSDIQPMLERVGNGAGLHSHLYFLSAPRGGGQIALLKAQSTQTMEYCAREAAQIFGGLSYTRGGQAEKVERLYREVRAYGESAYLVMTLHGSDN
jgi:alkylation response protein AidB-like acyl-CoA dehydrogenase